MGVTGTFAAGLGCRPTWESPYWYSGYRIYANDTPAPYSYCFQHDSYDGAPDANDNRYGFANSIKDCCEEIDEREDS